MAVADARRVEGRLGFHDLLVHARRLLRDDPGAAQSLRRRYRRLLIDEFQDTDPIQVELAARIAATVDGSARPGPRREGRALRGGRPQAVDLPLPPGRHRVVLAGRSRSSGSRSCSSPTSARCRASSTFVNTVFDELFGVEPVPGQAAHHASIGERAPLPLRYRGGLDGPGHGPAPPRRPRSRVRRRAVVARRARARPRPTKRPTPPRRGRDPAATGSPGDAPCRLAGRTHEDEHRRGAAGRRPRRGRHHRRRPPEPLGRGRRGGRRRPGGALARHRRAAPGPHGPRRRSKRPSRRPASPTGSKASRCCGDPTRCATSSPSCTPRTIPSTRVAVLGALRSPGLACGDDDLVTWHQAEGTLGPAPSPRPRASRPIPWPAPWRYWPGCTTSAGGASPRPWWRGPSRSCAASSSVSPTTGPATTGNGCAGSWTRPGSSTRPWAGRCGPSWAGPSSRPRTTAAAAAWAPLTPTTTPCAS